MNGAQNHNWVGCKDFPGPRQFQQSSIECKMIVELQNKMFLDVTDKTD
jgi:hypothetical protein